jgi:hypothetical protein
MQILVVLWDLLFLEGSSILLKAIIVLIDELEPAILACKDISIASSTQHNFSRKSKASRRRPTWKKDVSSIGFAASSSIASCSLSPDASINCSWWETPKMQGKK